MNGPRSDLYYVLKLEKVGSEIIFRIIIRMRIVIEIYILTYIM